jgi:amino acid transporter
MAFGRRGRVAFSWTYVVAILAGVAIGATMAVYYAEVLIADVFSVTVSGYGNILALAAVVGAAAMIAFRGIKFSTELMLAIECQSLGCMGILMLLALIREGRIYDPAQFHLAEVAGFSGGRLQLAFGVAFSCLAGFESATALGEEARQATKAIPRVMINVIVPLGLVYIATAYFLVLLFHRSPVGLDQTDAPFRLLAQSVHLPWLGTLVSAGIFLSCFASVSACLNAGSRVIYDLSRNGEFWPSFGAVQSTFATPSRAIALVAVLGFAAPFGMLVVGIPLLDCIAYTGQLAGIASIATYILVTVAAPAFLLRLGELEPLKVAVCTASLAILGTATFFNLFPVPPWPWKILPYAFLASVLAGLSCTAAFRATTPVSGIQEFS